MKVREHVNEYGMPISVHVCEDCGEEFTVCPPGGEDWGGCLADTCISYDPKRDGDILMGFKDAVRIDN